MNTAARYNRISRLAAVGEEGLAKLARSRITLVGCGTLGGVLAENLTRLGVAKLRLIDRDIVEEHNLSTQGLFDEEDARQIMPKAVAAQRHLQRINTACQIEAQATDLTADNVESLLGHADLILDATDNFETRFLINDAAVKLGIPWIYSAVVGFSGVTMAIVPGRIACLRCLMDSPPNPGTMPTCETAGVWPAAAQSVAAVALTEALRMLLGQEPKSGLSELDFDANQWRSVDVPRRRNCPACIRREFPYLEGRLGAQAIKLCGRDMVHLSLQREMAYDLSALAENLRRVGEVKLTEYLLHARLAEAEIYLFPDGRAFVKGVADPARAKAIFSRYVSL